MKILRCHIENFGKLKDLTIDFTDNLHVIHEDNGWGKSTLAAFIKVMFYGFANEGKRSEVENERKRYKPWQGGAYGGKIAFEVNGKSYEFTRIFGDRDKEDKFSLTDMKTNLPSEDYSSDLGEELFKIDRESFSRTIFIAQSDIATNATDSINAKIGNLVENTDDINNYDVVQERFKKLQNNMSPTRSTGTIKRKKEEMARLESNISRGKSIDQAIEELTGKLHRRKAARDRLKEEQTAIQKQMAQISGYKDLQSEKEAYERICLEHDRVLNTVTEEQRYFPAAVPTEAELQRVSEETDKLAGYQGELQSFELTDTELCDKIRLMEQFHTGVPDMEVITICKQKIKEHSDLRIKIAGTKPGAEDEEKLVRLEARFGDQVPDDSVLNQYISMWNQRTELKSGLGASKAALKALKTIRGLAREDTEKDAGSGKHGMIPLILGIMALCLGLPGIAGDLLPFAAGLVCFGTGIVLIAVSFLLKAKKGAEDATAESQAPPEAGNWRELEAQIIKEEETIRNAEVDIEMFFRQYGLSFAESDVISDLYELKKEIQDYKALASRKQRYRASGLEAASQELEREISEFLQNYDSDSAITADSYSARIQRLEDRRTEYGRLMKQESRYKAARLNYDLSYQIISEFITTLGFELKENLSDQLREIRDHMRSLAAAKKMAREKQQEKEVFEREKDVRRYKELEAVDLQPLENLNQQFADNASLLEDADNEIASYNRQVDGLTEERELLDEDEVQWNILKEELEYDLHQYQIISQTKDFLEKAKANFTARYIGPVMAGFAKYHSILTDEDAAGYKIDANINITAKEHGEQRNPRLLSTGYQNLVGICMRMALVDAMFKDEKPFLVVDDSFANLDNDKVRGGLKFLSEVAKEYQVIYFTCHKSRI